MQIGLEKRVRNFIFELSDGKKITKDIAAKDKAEALSIALSALSTYSSSKFPPPERIEITVSDENRRRLATMRFIYEIDLAPDTDAENIALDGKV
ncbi:hypothetical protein EON80_31910 [bacterium]|nr:MAG: hypothetical protein EON80_31910 [bacterium]